MRGWLMRLKYCDINRQIYEWHFEGEKLWEEIMAQRA